VLHPKRGFCKLFKHILVEKRGRKRCEGGGVRGKFHYLQLKDLGKREGRGGKKKEKELEEEVKCEGRNQFDSPLYTVQGSED